MCLVLSLIKATTVVSDENLTGDLRQRYSGLSNDVFFLSVAITKKNRAMQRPNASVSFNGDKDVVMFKMVQAARRNLKTDSGDNGIGFGRNINETNDASCDENRNIKNIRKKIKHQSESYSSSDEDDRMGDRSYNKYRQHRSSEGSKREVGYTPNVKVSRSTSNRKIDAKPSLNNNKRLSKDLKRKHGRSNRDDVYDEEY